MEKILMNIILIVDDYLPNSTRVAAKMMHEFSLELLRLGYNPIVITPSNSKQSAVLSIETLDNISVWRFSNGNVKNPNKFFRLYNELTLSKNAWRGIQNEISNIEVSGIIYYSPSIFWGRLISQIKKIHKCNAYLILRDMFPQWVIDSKIIKPNSLLAKYFRFYEELSYSQADKIGLMSENNLRLFKEKYSSYSNVEVLHNWIAVDKNIRLTDKKNRDTVIFFYGGNIGIAQDIRMLLELAVLMKSERKALFLFAGQGDCVSLINTYIHREQLTNVQYIGHVSQEEYLDILSKVDVGLFSLNVKHNTHNFPGKVLGYLNYNLPVLGSVNPQNDIKDIINKYQCGLVIDNQSVKDLYEAAFELLDDYKRERFSLNCKQLLTSKFSVSSAVKTVLGALL